MKALILSFTLMAGSALLMAVSAEAFCGGFRQSAQNYNVRKASKEARQLIKQEIWNLRRKHGKKLKVGDLEQNCLGGAVGIDKNGKQVVGPSTCTASITYCVNP